MADGFAYQPEGLAAIVARITALEKAQQDLRRAITGLGLSIDSDGNLTFGTGRDLVLEDGSSFEIKDGGSATISGDTTISGDLTVSGTFSLPDESIQDDWLANPIAAKGNYGSATNFSLGTAEKQVASASITVPAGFSRAIVIALADMVIWNGNSFGVTVNLRAEIGSVAADFAPATNIDATHFASVSSGFTTVLTGLSGGTITAKAMAYTGSSVPASGSNGAQVGETVMFLR